MNVDLRLSTIISNLTLKISGSKSETNRLLLLQALFPQLEIDNASDSDDSIAMADALRSEADVINIGHAGTAMRFLTAYFASDPARNITLTGSERMQQRPIKILVDALRELGASIKYVCQDGFPPIAIEGKNLTGGMVSLDANVSSQYISALMMIGAKMVNGLQINLQGEVTSAPYINMTLSLLKEIGIECKFEDSIITIAPRPVVDTLKYTIESDWSSASYFYSIIALSEIGTQITLSSFRQNSLQGDSALAEIYRNFGVETTFEQNSMTLSKSKILHPAPCTLHLNNTPDIAQTIAVTCFGLGIACHLSGLQTLTIKETDRLRALKTELGKLGATVMITSQSIVVEASSNINPHIEIDTYDDHRMAMAFAPLALKVPITINDAEVVSKSYSAFWDHLKMIGFNISAKD